MKTYTRICIKNYTVTDQEGNSCTIKKGKEYITSPKKKDDTVVVFTNYWVKVPIEIFGKNNKIFTKE